MGLRIVDAKFAVSKKERGDDGEKEGFVNFRMLEYPGEHDDITISFEGEGGMLPLRWLMVKVLVLMFIRAR